MNRISLVRAAVLATAVASLMPLVSHAWSGYQHVTVTELTVYPVGSAVVPGVLIRFTPITPSDTENCSQSGTGYAWIDFTATGQPDGKSVYAMALAAQMAGKTLGIGVHGCTAQGYPKIYGLNSYP